MYRNTVTSASYRKEFRRKLLQIREGLRWLKLKNLTGGEEIYLLYNPLRDREPGRKSRLLDIPYILEHGSDEAFNGLVKLLEPSQSWVRRTCVQLRGIVSWMKEAIDVCGSDKDAALSLSRLIQKTVDHTFGDRDLENTPTECEIESFFGANPREVANILRDIFKGGKNLSLNETEDDGEDYDGKIDEEISLLIKSIRPMLMDLHNTQESGACP